MWCVTLRLLQGSAKAPWPLAQRRRPPMRRGSLLAELDKPPEMNTSTCSSITALSSLNRTSDYLIPSHYSRKLRKAAMVASTHRDPLDADGTLNKWSTHSEKSDSDSAHVPISSIAISAAQHTALREMFNDKTRQRIRLRKDSAWLRAERGAFHQTHRRHPTTTEVSPFVEVSLAPIAALKMAKYLSPDSAAREAVVRGILLQQNVTRSELVQSGERTLFRCLRCFHVYPARPRTLLRDEVGHSWLEYEKEQKRSKEAMDLARRPGRRKGKESVGRQRAKFAADPCSCPSCGSPKAQWMMEYVHHSTHA